MIWLVGDKGMLGAALSEVLIAADLEFEGTDREVDIISPTALQSFASGKRIAWIVNCAAYTDVEKAEDEDQQELCTRLNAEGPGNIAELAKNIGAKLLHISTDYVFDGKSNSPYLEDDPISPISVYGRAKAVGEERVKTACPEHVILRTAWLYGKHGPNFVYTMLKLMRAKEKIGVVCDQRGSPTNVADLAKAIVEILIAPKTYYGIFQFTNLGETNWYEFALEIQKLGKEYGILSRDCLVEALTTAQFSTRAKRPAYSVLSKGEILKRYGLAIPEWKESLSSFMKDIIADGETKCFYLS